MEESTTSFFTNGLKVHIESSIKKYEQNQNIIFDKDFDNILLNPLFINNINLFRDIISQNELNFQLFWNHIGKLMKTSIQQLIDKFEEEIKKINEENKEKIELGNINILKLKILNICLYFITNEESNDFQLVDNNEKEIFKNLLELYIKKEIENNNDFSLFIKNYIIKIVLLINDNYRKINFGILKFLSFTCYNFESLFMNKEQMNNLKIYIDQTINNPKLEINNYLNGAMNKKNYKKEKFSRSRRASFDIRDININANNIEKNKKIEDFFKASKKEKKEKSEKNNSDEKSGGTRETENIQNNIINKNNENEINNNINKLNQIHTQSKPLHFSSHTSNLSLFNLNSGISNHSNSFHLNNSFSLSKNNNINNSRISLDDSFSLTNLFPTPLSELNEKNESQKFVAKFKFPTIKCEHTKKRKPFEKLKNKIFGSSQPNIKKYMKIEDKKGEEENKEIKEIRNVINSSFYGNENVDKITEKENNKNEEKNVNVKNKIKNGILIYKTPNKNNKENQDENINYNIEDNNIKKNWQLLFAQNTGLL